MDVYTVKDDSAQSCERCRMAANQCCCSPGLGDSDDPRTRWLDEEEPSSSHSPLMRVATLAGKQPRGPVHFVDDEAEEMDLDEPDLADYFGQFQMTRKEIIEFCRAHASALSKQEAYSKKIAKRVKK